MADEAEPPFTAEDVDGMLRHMNDDHADSVLAYARHFGGRSDATAAELRGMTARAMRVLAETPDGAVELDIPFDHPLESGHDAHMTMIRMSKRAKRALDGGE